MTLGKTDDAAIMASADLDGARHTRLSAANHRIANNLAMIAGLVRITIDRTRRQPGNGLSVEEMQECLYDVAARIDAMGRLHRRFAGDPGMTSLELGSCLRDLCDDLLASICKPGQYSIVYECGPTCRIAADQAAPLCLIVTEVLTNAIKYAHPSGVPGRITVACQRAAGGRIVLDVADDGVGLPENFVPARDGSLGFRLVDLLSRQLNARCDYHSTPLGLRFRLELPC
jgi:two-component sensor histidine kinase